MLKKQSRWRRRECQRTNAWYGRSHDYILKQLQVEKVFYYGITVNCAQPALSYGLQWNEMLETVVIKISVWLRPDAIWQACISDNEAWNVFCKGRRTDLEMALDQFSWCTPNAKIGISKIRSDAASVYLKYSYVIQNLPFFSTRCERKNWRCEEKMYLENLTILRAAKIKRQFPQGIT
jgi:hypothetical protein